MSEKSTKNAANNMVDLIRELIQQELIKEDNTATCRIMACNSDGSYDINVLPDMVTVIRSVKSISPENLKQGDYAYIFKFKNKLNNAVIIAKIGGLGSDVRFLTAKDENGNTVNISGGPFLPLTGGTLTGNLDVTPDSTSSHKHVKVNAPSGSAYAELSTFTSSSTTRARLTLNDGSGSPTEYRTQEIKIGNYTLSFPVLSANKTIATTDYVSGVNDGTNWTSITINGVTKSIPAAGSTDNQRIKVGSTTFGDNDVIDIVAGANISAIGATSGTGAPKITISATDKYHTTGQWSGLTYTATANGGADPLAFTLPTDWGNNSLTVNSLGIKFNGTTVCGGFASSSTGALTIESPTSVGFDTPNVDVSTTTLKLKTINAPTASGGTTYGPGTSGQVLKSNGTTVYWATDTNSNQTVKVGNTTFDADAAVGFIAGNNVDSIVADTTNNTITINTHDTTYNEATTTTAGLMSAADKTKLNGIAAGAEVNVQSDWNVTDSNSDAFIKNKPSIPTVYLKNASVSGNTLTITKQDNATVTYNPITEIMTAFDEDVAEAFLDNDYPSFIKLVDDGHGNPRFAFDTTNYSVVSGTDDGTNWTSITINGVTKVIPNDNDNQTILGNGTAFGANDAVNILGTSNLVTVTANTTNKTITVNLADAYGDTKNPYGNKAANLVLASPNGSTGAPQFRALVAADIPDLRGTYLPRAGGSSYPMTGPLYVKGSGATSATKATSITTNTSSAPHIYITGDTNNSGKVFLDSLIIGDPGTSGTSVFARRHDTYGTYYNRTYTLPDATGEFILDSNAQTISGLKTFSNANGIAFTDSHTTSYIKPYTYGDGSDIPYESGLQLDAQHVILSGNSFMGSGVVAVNNGSLYVNGLNINRGTNCIYFGLDTDSMTNNGFYFQGVSDSNSPRLQPNANGYGLRLPDTSSWSADRTVATTSDIGNGTLTIQGNGTAASTFTANQSGNTTLNIKGGGITSVTKTANNEITITSTEADTLASVTGRGAITSTAITLNGGLTVTGTADVSGGTLKLRTINAPTSSGGTTYGPGSNGQVLKSNGSTVYWATDTNSDTWRAIYVDGAEKLGTRIDSGALNFVSQNANDGDVTFTYDMPMAALKAKAKIPTALKNPNAIKIQGGGQDVASYDGSAAKTINIAASSTAGAFTITDGTTTRTIQLAGSFTDYNQTIKVGNTTFGANAVIELIAGNNVDSIVANTTNNTITINTHDTTYTTATTSAAGLMSAADKTKLEGIASGAEVNVQSDWSVTDSSSDAFIKNKPTIPTSFNLIDDILDGSANKYAPYAVGDKAAGRLYVGTTNPTNTTRLNYDGYFYATKLYSNGTEVSVSGHDHDTRYVRYDSAQTLNNTQKETARTNIGALSLHGGSADGDFVLTGAGGETITFALDGLIKLQGYGSGDGGGILISSQSGSSAKFARLKTTNLTADRNYEFPNKGGTFAMTTDILNPANYYWADVSVSSSSNKGTTPTVSKITIGGSGSTAGKATMQYNATEDCIDFVFA